MTGATSDGAHSYVSRPEEGLVMAVKPLPNCSANMGLMCWERVATRSEECESIITLDKSGRSRCHDSATAME